MSSDLDFNEFYYAAHCRRAGDENWTLTDLFNVGWNNQHDEAAHEYRITIQTWEGLHQWYRYDGGRGSRAQQSIDALNDISIHLKYDGKETVSQPIGSFFGIALGKFDVRSLLQSVDTFVDNGAFTSRFPMPFSKSMELSLSCAGSGNSCDRDCFHQMARRRLAQVKLRLVEMGVLRHSAPSCRNQNGTALDFPLKSRLWRSVWYHSRYSRHHPTSEQYLGIP